MAKRFIGGDTSVSPAGSIQAFAGANVPHGWLLCDGEVYDISQFPALAAALDGAWDSFAHPVDGTPSVGAGQFAVPNMKGLYLSGAGNAGGDARSLGVFQADKTAKNGLGFSMTNNSSTYSLPGALTGNGNNASPYNTGARGTPIDSMIKGTPYSSTITDSIVIASDDNETRPKTAPVNYIIKY